MILLKKLNFLLATFALEQGGKRGRGAGRLRAVPRNQLNKFYVKAVYFFFWSTERSILQTQRGILE